MQERNVPFVSFILTYYNLPTELLCGCIDTILSLSLPTEEREIIVVDDGSDESPMDALLKYGDDIVYIRRRNGGLSVARNTGLDIAKGRYVQFIDADDRLIKPAYEHCLELLRQRPDTDLLMFDFSEQPQGNTDFKEEPSCSGTEYMHHHNIHGTAWGYLFRRNILGSLRFTPGIYHEDEEFTPQLLLRAEQVCATTAQAYYYNKRPGSIITRTDEHSRRKRMDDRKHVIYHLHELCDRLSNNERLAMQRRVAQLTMDYIYNVIKEGHTRKVIDEELAELRSRGLFPLPDRNYTTKYKWFRRMSNTRLGLSLLTYALPLIKQER